MGGYAGNHANLHSVGGRDASALHENAGHLTGPDRSEVVPNKVLETLPLSRPPFGGEGALDSLRVRSPISGDLLRAREIVHHQVGCDIPPLIPFAPLRLDAIVEPIVND